MKVKNKLKGLKNDISLEKKFIGLKKYSHNIISIIIRAIMREYGKQEANKTIKDFKLLKLGWSYIK
jgi:hypothetical protein